jgi:hypothetical protein
LDPLTPDILAPGDGKSATLDPSIYTWTRILSAQDPAFERAYSALWAEFGAAHEMESREVIAARFGALAYEMLLVEKDGVFCAVRDHTAVWCDGQVVVHLSHALVAPEQRRSGLAGWLRGAPVLAARRLAASQGVPDAPITLVGEMEYDDGSDPKRSIRLMAYERAGYVKVDSVAVRYFQPDFRHSDLIDAAGGSVPLPFQLIIRRVGRESEGVIRGADVRRLISALYMIYSAQFRRLEMQHPLLSMERYPAPDATIALVPPTSAQSVVR